MSGGQAETTAIVVKPAPTKKSKRALSTERSRLCRQRQKAYADTVEQQVKALRAELDSLRLLRDLRQEQSVHSMHSLSGSAARIVREYCAIFQNGMDRESKALRAALLPTSVGSKRGRPDDSRPVPEIQREFLTSVMSPFLEVYDWCGRFAIGTGTLVNGWSAWSAWHSSLSFELQSVQVIDGGDMLAVQTEANLRVVVSETTIERLFPHVAHDERLLRKLLGQEICYQMKDTFYFSDDRRVVKYSCDMDFVAALLPVAGDLATTIYLITPPNQASLNDLAIRTTPADRANRSPLDMDFLLAN